MNGEFKIELKTFDPITIVRIFEEEYGQKLDVAYKKSDFSKDADLDVTDFYAGYWCIDHGHCGSAA